MTLKMKRYLLCTEKRNDFGKTNHIILFLIYL